MYHIYRYPNKAAFENSEHDSHTRREDVHHAQQEFADQCQQGNPGQVVELIREFGGSRFRTRAVVEVMPRPY